LFWKDDTLIAANFVDVFAESGVVKHALIKALSQPKSGSYQSLPVVQDMLMKGIIAEVEEA
jgi:hypothetical protein